MPAFLPLTTKVAQYPLYDVTYTPAHFEVEISNGSIDELSRKYII